MVFGPLLVCLFAPGNSGILAGCGLLGGVMAGSWLTVLIMPCSQSSHEFCSPLFLHPPAPPPSLPHGGWHDLFRGQREEPQGKRASLDMLLEMEIAFPKPSSSLAHSGNEPPQT